jgi:hypothetical protein
MGKRKGWMVVGIGCVACIGVVGAVWSSLPWGDSHERYRVLSKDPRVGALVLRAVIECTAEVDERSGCLAEHEDGSVVAIDHIGATGIVRTRRVGDRGRAASMGVALVPIKRIVTEKDVGYTELAARFVKGK